MKVVLLTLFLVISSYGNSFSAENITVDTKTDNLFENIVSDTLLLLAPDLKRIIEDDFAHVVANSKFSVPVNSWKPRLNPKNKLATIYSRINSNNIKESFASLVQPIVELACTPQYSDPLNEHQSKCIRELFRYRIIETVKIRYTYRPNTTIEQNIENLTSLSSRFRYHQIVCSLADIMNKSYEQVSKKNIIKNVNIVKYPQPLIATYESESEKKAAYYKTGSKFKSEKFILEKQIDEKRFGCQDGTYNPSRRQACDKSVNELKMLLEELESNPSLYFSQGPAREARARAKTQVEGRERAARREQATAQAKQDAEEHQQMEHQRMQEEMGPIVRLPNGQAINTGSGEFLAPSGNGYVGTRDGTYYAPAGHNGFINSNTGTFTPVTR